jgi:hypothetical protein
MGGISTESRAYFEGMDANRQRNSEGLEFVKQSMSHDGNGTLHCKGHGFEYATCYPTSPSKVPFVLFVLAHFDSGFQTMTYFLRP